MKKYWVEMCDDWRDSPMAFWVHADYNGESWLKAYEYYPPAPRLVNGKYLKLKVEIFNVILEFTSKEQVNDFIRLADKKLLPTTLSLTKNSKRGPNSHWLSRLPAKIKSYKKRVSIVKYLIDIKDTIEW